MNPFKILWYLLFGLIRCIGMVVWVLGWLVVMVVIFIWWLLELGSDGEIDYTGEIFDWYSCDVFDWIMGI